MPWYATVAVCLVLYAASCVAPCIIVYAVADPYNHRPDSDRWKQTFLVGLLWPFWAVYVLAVYCFYTFWKGYR